jgi:CheY-like chemotaxis protein/two-component sensor histidine kinase
MLDLTLDMNLNDESQDILSVAKDPAENLLGLLNDILDLSRVEAGKITLEMIEMNIPNVVRSVVKGLSVIARNKGLELECHIDERAPEIVIGDPVRLRQVLINLINNAIKFTHKGSVRTSMEVVSLKDDQAVLMFAVADDGIGIPKDKQDSVFEVFTQADDSTTRRFGGTGLGLAISKRLVEMMGGRIWVESEELKGSTFSFTGEFKIVQQKASPKSQAQAAAVPGALDVKAILNESRILLAEDNLVNQKIAQKMLEKQGCVVKAVDNGKDVLNLLESEKFDVILMDVHMPMLDGLATSKLIRENEEKTGHHIPIIALTARAMAEDRQRCMDAGMDGYVSKPIDRTKMFEEIAKHIQENAS